METALFKTDKTIGNLLILAGIALFIPYSILSATFEYPVILRQDVGVILTKFHEGGNSLIWTWWAFAMVGLPLLPAYVLIGQKLENKLPFVRWATYIGVISLIVQMLGLLRWTFVVPVLADNYLTGNEMTKEAAKVAFQVIHQYGGVVLGEHVGQLFTIIWTVMICYAFEKLHLMPRWLTRFGYGASAIYLLAQTELFATVMPGFPVVDLAGFIGSTLWLVWLIVLGFKFRQRGSLQRGSRG
ncbi:MAG TPA: DUF4386 domain-containing protein [Saprospiraceae bacterium]|mgnify:FL=1|nr:DUF4386 domain-containing protein [Saprospiraceae bacterium]